MPSKGVHNFASMLWVSSAFALMVATGCADTVDPVAALQDEGSGPATESDTGELEGVCEDDPLTLARPEHWTRASHCKGEPPDYDRLFDDGRVQRMDISMSAEDAAAMYEDLTQMYGPFGAGAMMPPPSSDEDPIYVPVTLEYDGRQWTEVGMRYKGNSSLRYSWQLGIPKISFRLNFDKFADDVPELENQRFWGFREMTFSSSYKDPSFLRDKLSAEIFRAAGVPAAMSSFIELWVDQGDGPVYWGVFIMIEDVSDEMVQSQYVEGGNLYKPDGGAANWTSFDPDSFPKKTNEEEADWSDIEAAIAALHADGSDAATWRSELEAVFDVPAFLRWLAINQILYNWDTYGTAPHNYYVYADPADDGRLTWIPWDLNLTFNPGTPKSPLSIPLDEVSDEWPLIRKLLDDPIYRPMYFAEVERAVTEVMDASQLEARILAYHQLLDPYVQAEQAPYTQLSGYQEFVDSVYDADTALVPYVYDRLAAASGALPGQ